ncbi:hypothetical protein L100_04931 [Elizabethkingia meningoseptica ATCC 13253 = NBRC 12535]|nr:hypothetical protein L100_04931 [Elizabethkingia meningoseptica ATCC 13253 = NBRC 12535]
MGMLPLREDINMGSKLENGNILLEILYISGIRLEKTMIITHYFYPDKTIMARGQSRLDITKDGKRHWYKFGPWYEYDKNGNLLWIKYYKDGNLYQYQENGIMKYDVKKFF